MIRQQVVAVALILAGCSRGSGGDDADSAKPPVALVALAPVERGGVTDRVTLYGIAEPGASGTATISASIDAQVVRIVAPIGTRVGAGQIMALLAPAPNARLDLVKAQTDARLADAAYARAQRLRKDGLVSDADVEQARAGAAAADATRTSLNQRAQALTLRAPAAGYVQTVAVTPGDIVQPGAAIATVARAGDLRAHFGIDPALARTLRIGEPIRVEAGPGRAAFSIAVSSVTPLVDPQTRLAAMFADLPPGGGIGAGETLVGSVAIGGRDDALTVPYAALLDDGGQPYLFVEAGGVAHRRDVALGEAQGDRIAITRGVRLGDRVVTQGGTAVADGMKVRTR